MDSWCLSDSWFVHCYEERIYDKLQKCGMLLVSCSHIWIFSNWHGIEEGGSSSSGMIRWVVFICCMQAWMLRVWQLQCKRIYIHPWFQRLGDFPVFFVLWKNKPPGKFLGLETLEWHFSPPHSGLPFCLQVGMSNQLGLPQDMLSAFLAA